MWIRLSLPLRALSVYCCQCVAVKIQHGVLALLASNLARSTWKARIFLGWTPLRDHPPPKPPFQCPHQTKKDTNLLILFMHPFAYPSRPETEVLQSYGAKTEIRTPMYTRPTRQPQLPCTAPHCFHFLIIPLSCQHSMC